MGSETVGDYEIEYEGVQLPEKEGWGAYVTVYGPSTNPMHRNSIVPTQQVAVETVFATQAAAEAEARKVALSLLEHGSRDRPLSGAPTSPINPHGAGKPQ